MYYMLIFVRLDPAPYLLIRFLNSLKYLHFLFLPNIFPELDGYNIPEYNTFLPNTSFLYNCSPFIFIFGFAIIVYAIFSVLKSKKLISSKRIRGIAKSIRRYRLKYMIFHDAFWVTFLYITFMALLQIRQASLSSLWDSVNIVLAIIVAILYLLFTISMIYLGNKYKNAIPSNKKEK